MRLYGTVGHAYLVCPRLLELDRRHGEHPSKWAPCRRGANCRRPAPHKHEEELVDPEGHTVNDFFWVPGCRPPEPDEHPVCEACGRKLVHADLDDLYHPSHLVGDVLPPPAPPRGGPPTNG